MLSTLVESSMESWGRVQSGMWVMPTNDIVLLREEYDI